MCVYIICSSPSMVQKTSAGAKAAPKPQQRGTSFGALDTASHGDVKTNKMKWVYHGIPSSNLV